MLVIYGLFLCASIITVLFTAQRKFGKDKAAARRLKRIEENKSDFNQFKVLPYNVKPLHVEHLNMGKLRITLTPTHFKQIDEFYFSLPIKAKHEEGDIGFELMINGLASTPEGEQPVAGEKMTRVMLDGTSEIADKFLKILARLFEVELIEKAQVVKTLFLYSEEEKVNEESLYKGHEFILFFDHKDVSDTTPAIRLTINLEKGDVIIEELDTIFRPIIIDRLTFKPNIRQ